MPLLSPTVTLIFASNQLRVTLSSSTVTGATGGVIWQILMRPKGGVQYTTYQARLVGTTLAIADFIKPYAQEVIVRAIDSIGVIYDSLVNVFDAFALAVTDFPVIDLPRRSANGVAGNVFGYTVDNDGTKWNAPDVVAGSLIGVGTTTITKTTVNGVSQFAFSSVAPLGTFFTGISGGGF